jgi:hypothetical protein
MYASVRPSIFFSIGGATLIAVAASPVCDQLGGLRDAGSRADRAIYVTPAIESFRLARHRARTSRAPPGCCERLLLRSHPARAGVEVPRVGRRSRVATVRRI